jgi:P pilus assembly chaperone PapD
MFPKTYFKKQTSLLKKITGYCIVSIFFCTAFLSSASAQGNLLVTPKRVVFEGSKRSEELNLANIGKDSATYDISFVQLRMKEDGTVETITAPDSGQNFADKYLRFFPRSVTLAPNEAQTVKVQIIRTAEITPGEYRSHLYFRAVPNEKPLGEKEVVKKDSSISVRIVPIFGISLPVIVRAGESNTQVKLSELSLVDKDKSPALKLTFNRKGNMSVYGDVLVDHISPDGKVSHVGVVRGLAVYTPNATRHFNLALNKAQGVNFNSGKLHVVYVADQDKGVKLAEEFINLN